MENKKYRLFPANLKYVRPDKNLLLINVFYHNELDILFITYKDSITGKKIMDEIHQPVIPIFISNTKLKQFEQHYPIDKCTRHLVRYNKRYRADDIKQLLYDYKEVSYVDSYGVKQYKRIYKDIPKAGFSLNPNLFGYGDTIEQLIIKEYSLMRFEEHHGFASEVLPTVNYRMASFDIETIQEDDTTKININTFIDETDCKAYGIFVKDYDKYPYQDLIMKHQDKFKKELKETLIAEINKSPILSKNDPEVQALKNKFIKFTEDLDIVLIEEESEEKLIKDSIDIMFNKHCPDILAAFNTPYDITHFQKRIEELGLPIGLMNDPKYVDTRPKFMENMIMPDWKLFGDTRTSKKRSCNLSVIRPTRIMDYQMIYYSNKSFMTFNSESLDNTSLRELGFGKLDYSKWSNSVVTLPYKNFWIHLMYGIIDSILIIFLNMKLHDIENKLLFSLITKNNVEATVNSNPNISNWVFTSVLYQGQIHGVNTNKLIKSLNNEELKQMSEIIDVDLFKYKENIPSRYLDEEDDEDIDEAKLINCDVEYIDSTIKIRGGIVSPPQNYLYNFEDYKCFNVLNNEVNIRTLLKIKNDAYLDFKSHYPYSFIVRNLFKVTINAEIVSLITPDGSIIYSKYLHKMNKKYRENFGFINTTIINDDIVTFAHITTNTPPMVDLIKEFIPLDSNPKFFVEKTLEFERSIDNKEYDKLISLLSKLDKSKFSDTETNFFEGTQKTFYITNASTRYYGSKVTYNYTTGSLYSKMVESNTIKQVDGINEDTPVLVTVEKKNMISKQELHPNDLIERDYSNLEFSEFREFTIDTLMAMQEQDFNATRRNYGYIPTKMCITNNTIYYPFEYYLKNIRKKMDSNKVPVVTCLQYKYCQQQATTMIIYRYNILYKDINLEITQTQCVVNLSNAR